MNKHSILLALIFVSCSLLANCQKDSTIKITSSVIHIDTLSLVNSLLNTVFTLDSTCKRGTCNSDYVLIVCSTISSGASSLITIIDGDCLSTEQFHFREYSVKGISYYRNRRILWLNELPPKELLCHNTGEEDSFSFSDDEELPLRDNIPITYCYYFDRQISIFKRTGCFDLEHKANTYPIIIQ